MQGLLGFRANAYGMSLLKFNIKSSATRLTAVHCFPSLILNQHDSIQSFLIKMPMVTIHNHYNFQRFSPAGHVKGRQKLTHFSNTSVKWLWSSTHPVKKHTAILDADISKFIFGEEKGRKAPYIYVKATQLVFKHTTEQLLETPYSGTTM